METKCSEYTWNCELCLADSFCRFCPSTGTCLAIGDHSRCLGDDELYNYGSCKELNDYLSVSGIVTAGILLICFMLLCLCLVTIALPKKKTKKSGELISPNLGVLENPTSPQGTKVPFYILPVHSQQGTDVLVPPPEAAPQWDTNYWWQGPVDPPTVGAYPPGPDAYQPDALPVPVVYGPVERSEAPTVPQTPTKLQVVGKEAIDLVRDDLENERQRNQELKDKLQVLQAVVRANEKEMEALSPRSNPPLTPRDFSPKLVPRKAEDSLHRQEDQTVETHLLRN